MGTYTLTVTTPTNNGTIKTQNTSSTPLSTGKTWGGTVNYNTTTGGQTVVSGTYGNLTLSNSSGTQTLGGAITLTSNGTLNVSSGTFDPSTYLITGSGTNTLSVSNGATIRVGASTFAGNYSSGFTTKTLSSGSTVDYFSSGAQTIDGSLSYSNLSTSTGGTKSLGAVTTATGAVTINSGSTLDTTSANYYTLNAGSIVMNGGTFLPQASIINLTGTSTVFNYTSGTITPATSTFEITDTSSNNKTFAGGGHAYNNIWITGAGTGDYTITGSNTFNDFKVDTPPHTINFGAGSSTSLTTFTVSGTVGNYNIFKSTTSGSPWTITSLNASPIVLNYISISDSIASGSGAFQALNSQDGGMNLGWLFGATLTRTAGLSGGGSSGNIDSNATPNAGVSGGGTGGGNNIVLPQCSDSIDNDSDGNTDTNDANCHLDGDLQKAYVPTWNSETTSPVSNTGGGEGGGSTGDLGYLLDKIYSVIGSVNNNSLWKLLLASVYTPFY